MYRPIPTSIHAVLDYVTAPTLLTLPRALGWGKKTTNIMTGIGLGMLAQSIMTKYELGIFKMLPMKGHLAMDAVVGAATAALPFMLDKEERTGSVMGVMIGVGLFEIAAALTTQTEPSILGETGGITENVTQIVNKQKEMVGLGS